MLENKIVVLVIITNSVTLKPIPNPFESNPKLVFILSLKPNFHLIN